MGCAVLGVLLFILSIVAIIYSLEIVSKITLKIVKKYDLRINDTDTWSGAPPCDRIYFEPLRWLVSRFGWVSIVIIVVVLAIL